MVTRPLSQKFLIGALVALGLVFIVLGAQRLYERYQVKQISLDFVKALQSGDGSQIRSLLTPEKADLAKNLKQDSQDSRARIDYRFLDVQLTGDTAQVSIQIQKNGYAIKPDIHLIKSRTGVWKVDSISQAKVDPLWYDQKDQLYREKLLKEKVPPTEVEGRVLAKELARALNTTVEEAPPVQVDP
ncbi:MAG: hypothetical protein K0U86_03610 [Planctomycetes bacterium]|nr:hypothetical protein [Planctomycetota bacterium]MCH9723972.1 hypothetical protein [Planctomycetota bacterium]MCH9778987.1 hypothetical protein [Planctomycetota bacterium]MCH9792359.1 hypothetical protein [Planctomycetota bacterium]MDF1746001.1 hypothetical protein [Gimesia sp.]